MAIIIIKPLATASWVSGACVCGEGEEGDYPMWNISSCLCAIEQNADKILIVCDQITPKVVVKALKQLEYELDAFMHEVTLSSVHWICF